MLTVLQQMRYSVFTVKLITPSLVQPGAGEVLHHGVVRSYVIQRGGPFNVRTNVTTRMHSNIILAGPWPPVHLGVGLTNAPGIASAETKHPFCRCCHAQARVHLQAHVCEVLFESIFLKGHHTWKIHQLQSTYRWEGSFLPTMYTSHSACTCNECDCHCSF